MHKLISLLLFYYKSFEKSFEKTICNDFCHVTIYHWGAYLISLCITAQRSMTFNIIFNEVEKLKYFGFEQLVICFLLLNAMWLFEFDFFIFNLISIV